MESKKLSNLSSSRASSIKMSTKVLLVCVYDTIIIQLTNDMVYNTFSPYGTIEKILIFQRGEVTKCFIQFATAQQTQAIKANLDGKKIANTFCKMHIFFSNLPEIDLKNKKTRGKDYSSSLSTQKNYESQIMSPKKKIQKQITFDDFQIPTYKNTPYQGELYKSKTDGQQLSKAIAKFRIQAESEEEFKVEDRIRWDIENIIEQPEDSFLENVQKINSKQSLQYKQIEYSPENIIQKQKSTQILYFAFQKKITIKQTYNLFSNFGNINKIFIKNFVIFIQFTTVLFAQTAKQYLNNTVLFGNLIRLRYGNKSQMQQKPRQYSEAVVYDQSYYRFNQTRSISLNPPSQTLHISNLKKQYCNPQKIKQLFYGIANVQKVSYFVQNKQRNMALVKFFTLQQSFRAVAEMHNSMVSGRKIQISFTKSKIS